MFKFWVQRHAAAVCPVRAEQQADQLGAARSDQPGNAKNFTGPQFQAHVLHSGAPAQAFGLFALSGRATAFIGPAAIAAVTALTGSQRLGISPVILLFLAGLALLCLVKTETEQPGTSPP